MRFLQTFRMTMRHHCVAIVKQLQSLGGETVTCLPSRSFPAAAGRSELCVAFPARTSGRQSTDADGRDFHRVVPPEQPGDEAARSALSKIEAVLPEQRHRAIADSGRDAIRPEGSAPLLMRSAPATRTKRGPPASSTRSSTCKQRSGETVVPFEQDRQRVDSSHPRPRRPG
ncbi:MAG: hypothetical protein MJE77_05065 [Proteobacteria bacterium]|nr:hypothetical protein [Pseudomonadota bacterium]